MSPEGSDSNTGTVQKPWKNPGFAIDKVQRIMAENPAVSVHLFFRGGEYVVSRPIVIDGSKLKKNLIISGMKGETAVLSGDIAIRNWKKSSDGILVSDLKEAGLEDLGSAVLDTNRFDLYFNGKRQTLARWPNDGFAISGAALGETVLPENWSHQRGTKEGIIEYLDSRISRWAQEKDAYCHAFWYWDWWDSYGRVADIDTTLKAIVFEEPYDYYGYRDNCRYYGVNLKCELDAPEEFYLDRDSSLLYWYAPKTYQDGDPVYASRYKGDYMLNLKDCESVQIDNLTFRGGRKGALSVSGGDAVTINNCHFTCMGEDAVFVEGHGHRVENCLLDELCGGGFKIKGGDRKTLEPSGIVISNNIVSNFSLARYTYKPAIHFTGAGLTITHNRFEKGPSSALRLEGNDVDVSFNQFFNLVSVSDDQGGLDVYGNFSYRRIVLRYNYWRDITGNGLCGAAAVRFDDSISGHIVYGNVFERCGGKHFGAVQINGGKDNYVTNNLFYTCNSALSSNEWDAGRMEYLIDLYKKNLDEVDCFGYLYRMRYPELNQPWNTNVTVNYAVDNLAVGMQSLYMNCTRLQTQNNTLLPEPLQPMEYYLQDSVLASYGLRPIPFSEIGPEGQ